MSQQYDNTNKGVLFIKHDRPTDKHPTMTGKININGTEYWLSGWTNYKKSDGEKYLSLAVNPMEEQPKHDPINDMDDLPF